jgi:titin
VTATAGSGSIEISWSAPASNGGAPITEYQVQRKADDGSFSTISKVDPSMTSHTDSDVDPGQEYTYKVRAVNRIGPSNGNDEITITAQGIPFPPEGIDATYGDGYVEVSWTPPLNTGGTPLTGYKVYRTQPDLEESLMIKDLGADVTSFRDENINYGQGYTYGIAAVNQHGESAQAFSALITPYGAPASPNGLVFETDSLDVHLTWSAPDSDGGCCIDLYRIYRVNWEGTEEHIGTVEGDSLSYIDHLEDGGDYTYKVSAVNSLGKCSDCAEVQVKVAGESSPSFVEEQTGLLVTIPLIVILIIALIVVLILRKGREDEMNTTPQPSFVEPNGDTSTNGGYAADMYDAQGGMLSYNGDYPEQ